MKISEIIARLNETRERRILAEELLKSASNVFDDLCPLEKLPEYYEIYWREIIYKSLFDSRFYYENKKEPGDIKQFFDRVEGAYINRQEFKELLKPFEKAVEVFIEDKKKEEEELKEAILSLYVEFFASHFENYSFIFGSEKNQARFY